MRSTRSEATRIPSHNLAPTSIFEFATPTNSFASSTMLNANRAIAHCATRVLRASKQTLDGVALFPGVLSDRSSAMELVRTGQGCLIEHTQHPRGKHRLYGRTVKRGTGRIRSLDG